jgi:hypothetical protein
VARGPRLILLAPNAWLLMVAERRPEVACGENARDSYANGGAGCCPLGWPAAAARAR